MNEQQRTHLRKFFKNEVLPLFPTYFEKIYEKRENDQNWNEGAPWVDMFVPMASHNPDTALEGTLSCVVPAPRLFWETWLALYQLENPDVFYNTSVAANVILREIKALKLAPSNFGNFEVYHLNYLSDLGSGSEPKPNMFLSNPFVTMISLKLAPMLEAARGGSPPDVFARTNLEFIQQSILMEEEYMNRFEKEYPEISNMIQNKDE